MDAQDLRGSLIAQREAAMFYRNARYWQGDALRRDPQTPLATDYAIEDQRIAAKLSLADRTFRGLE